MANLEKRRQRHVNDRVEQGESMSFGLRTGLGLYLAIGAMVSVLFFALAFTTPTFTRATRQGPNAAPLIAVNDPQALSNAPPPMAEGEAAPKGTATEKGTDKSNEKGGESGGAGASSAAVPPRMIIRAPTAFESLSLWVFDGYTAEQKAALIALLGGVVGGFGHGLQSFTTYVGNRRLTRSWLWWYFKRPCIGAVLAFVFYFLLRAGLVSPGTGGAAGSDANGVPISLHGVAAISLLVGLCNAQAAAKLQGVGRAIFDEPEGRDKLDAPKPVVTKVDPSPIMLPAAGATVTVTVTGKNFERGSKVSLGGGVFDAVDVKEDTLTFVIAAAQAPETGTQDLVVDGPGSVSAPFPVEIKPAS